MIPLSKTKAKYIKSLQLKKNRDKENLFLVEGKKSVLEFINSDFKIISIVSTEEFYVENKDLLDSFEIHQAKPTELSGIGTLKTNNTALAVVETPSKNTISNVDSGIILALDGINDPGNLGTIIRTADWFGIDRMILNDNSVDCYNPKVISASKGSISRVSVFSQSLVDFISEYKGEVIAADMYGKSVSKVEPIQSGVIIMGNESHGISKEVEAYVTQKVTIPAIGKAESLNVGVATGIICHHLVGQH